MLITYFEKVNSEASEADIFEALLAYLDPSETVYSPNLKREHIYGLNLRVLEVLTMESGDAPTKTYAKWPPTRNELYANCEAKNCSY